jgi:hypothetical protein
MTSSGLMAAVAMPTAPNNKNKVSDYALGSLAIYIDLHVH